MDRQMLLRHLAEAERHVAKGAGIVERERVIIGERRRDGHDVIEAERLLDTLEQVQRVHVDHLETIRKELADLG